MGITATELGDYSVRYDILGSYTDENLATQVKNFLTSHGWTPCHPNFSDSSNSMTFESLNVDGITKKYLKMRCNGNLYFYWGSGLSTDKFSLSPSYFGISKPYLSPASLFLSVSSKHLIWQSIYSGTTVSKWSSFQEMTSVHPEDVEPEYPQYSYIESSDYFYITGKFNLPKTKSQLGNSYTRCMIPLGSWGVLNDASTRPLSSILSYDTNPFTHKNQAFDVHGIVDVWEDRTYHKGLFYCLKVLNSGIGKTGDIVKIKVNDSFFIDPNGTEKDFIIFSNEEGNGYRVAFPA